MEKHMILIKSTLLFAFFFTLGPFSAYSQSEILKLVNEVRAKGCNCGNEYMPPVKPLRWNNRLEDAAKTQSDYMQRVRRMTHTGNRGSSPGSRATKAGYKWSFIAENIAAGQLTPKQVVNGWLGSVGHCKNIMNRNATEMGAAKTGKYWTQVFASPR